MSHGGWGTLRSLTRDSSVAKKKLAPGTGRRILAFARPYKRQISFFLVLVVIDRYVIAREEAYLARRFGADYEAYRSKVRRWL